MPIEARVIPSQDAFIRNRVQVIVHRVDGWNGRQVLVQHLGDPSVYPDEWRNIETGPAQEIDAPFVLDVDDDVARVVYLALRDRYERERPADGLARALDREAARVDKMLDKLLRADG